MAKKKFYVVWQGHIPGIYESWPEAQRQVVGFEGAKYKSFPSLKAADDAYFGNSSDYIGKKAKSTKRKTLDPNYADKVDWNSIAVDAACSGNPGIMEYRGVNTQTGAEYFRLGPFKQGTNNVGEFLALVHGLAFLKQQKSTIPIYSDSRTAMAWVRNKKQKTSLKRTVVNDKLFILMERAERWLKANTWQNKIIKWETKEWGEIPADFGRK